MKKKGLSIIIPYYKGEKFITQCIDSIINSYNQSNKLILYEIIVVIDSIEDQYHTESFLKEKYFDILDILIVRNDKNMGVAQSRNVGYLYAKYDFFTFIDQDDYVGLDYFSEIESRLNDDILVYIINGYRTFLTQGVKNTFFYVKPKFTLKSILNQETMIATPGLIIFNKKLNLKTIFIEPELYKGADDWGAYLNILLSHENITYDFIKKKIFFYCIHGSNYSSNIENMLKSTISILDIFLQNADYSRFHPLIIHEKNRLLLFFDRVINRISFIEQLKKYPSTCLDTYIGCLIRGQRNNELIKKFTVFCYNITKTGNKKSLRI